MKLLFIILLLSFSIISNSQNSGVTKMGHPVKLNYVHNKYSDYLFYLLYRYPYKKYEIDTVGIINETPTFNELISLPEIIASAHVNSYEEILNYSTIFKNANVPIIDSPFPKILNHSYNTPNYDSLVAILEMGKQYFPKFEQIWKDKIEPDEMRNIRSWEKQDSLNHPLEKLQYLTHIKFKSDSLDVGSLGLHLAGSGNYSPAGIYSATFKKPDLGWFIGHEGTHLLLTKYYGIDWHKNKLYPKALSLAQKLSFDPNSIEEMLCMFMQVELSKQCGETKPDFIISHAFKDDKIKYSILAEMEKNWKDYLSDKNKYNTIIDFMLACTIESFKKAIS